MDALKAVLPPTDKGLLPLYLVVAAAAAIGNIFNNFITLHFTRRLYNGLFIPNPAIGKLATKNGRSPEDSIHKVIPVEGAAAAKSPEKAQDQMTPLAARLFGIYSFVVGAIRIGAAYRLEDPTLYSLVILVHAVAAFHFTTEILIYKTMRPKWEHAFPLGAAYSGLIWSVLQYSHYVKA